MDSAGGAHQGRTQRKEKSEEGRKGHLRGEYS